MRKLLPCLSLFLAACATVPPGGASSGLAGTSWFVDSIAGAPVVTPSPTATFGTDGRISGDGGCNQYSGPYSLAGTQIGVGPLVSTRRACADGARTAQESRFLSAVQASTAATATNDRLVLSGPGGEVAFRRAG